MSGKIGVAIVGSGIFVKEQHLPAVLACPDLELKAIYSRTLASAQNVSKNLSNIDLYSEDSPDDKTYEALLARPDISAVIIALPIPIQPSYIKQALAAGKHVLAEKPVAKDLATAHELIDYYRKCQKGTLAIAEQFRYLPPFLAAAQEARKLGRVLGFRHRLNALAGPGGKYYETAWRKTPEYQGGFLLDGGVHFVAGMRMLLGADAKVVRTSAMTQQAQSHLPPMDTVDAIVGLEGGGTGSFSVSFGTTFTGPAEWSVACEKGSVKVVGDVVTVKPVDGEERVEEVKDERGGVKLEVFAWARGMVEEKADPRQSPEEALADLEVLEAMLRSGEKGGMPVELKLQI